MKRYQMKNFSLTKMQNLIVNQTMVMLLSLKIGKPMHGVKVGMPWE